AHASCGRLGASSLLFPYTTLFRCSGEGDFDAGVVIDGAAAHVGIALVDDGVGVGAPGELGPVALGGGHDAPADAVADLELGLERSEEHTSELHSRSDLVCRLLLEK